MARWHFWSNEPLRVTQDGRWLHGDEPLHPRVQRLFARHLVAPSQPGGEWAIVLAHDRQPLVVEDTALHVLAAHPQLDPAGGFQGADLVLSDGATEALDLGQLMQSADHVLYAAVPRAGGLWRCRFLPAAYYSLVLHLAIEDDARHFRAAGRRWAIAPL